MLVLHLVGRSHRRGAELVALELAEELDALGYRNRLVAVGSGHEGGVLAELPALVADSRQGPLVLLRAARRLRQILGEERPDVILAHGGSAAQVAVIAARSGGPSLVWQRILGFPRLDPVRRAWWRRVLGRVDAVVALTPNFDDEVRSLGYRGPTVVIPNARRSARFEAVDRAGARRALRSELSIPAGRSAIGLVGHLVEQKDPVEAVEAFADLVSDGTDAHLVVAGTGPLAGEVARSVEALGLAERASILGHVDEVEGLLCGLDLLWLTSRDEGVPGILVEAAMAGLPVVTHPVGDVADVVHDGSTGVVLRSAERPELVGETAVLLADVGRLAAMGEAARRRSRDLAMEVVVQDYARLLEEVVGVSGREVDRPS